MDSFWGQMLAFFVAFIPGVLIALIADYLSRRRDTERERRVNENARTLLALNQRQPQCAQGLLADTQ